MPTDDERERMRETVERIREDEREVVQMGEALERSSQNLSLVLRTNEYLRSELAKIVTCNDLSDARQIAMEALFHPL